MGSACFCPIDPVQASCLNTNSSLLHIGRCSQATWFHSLPFLDQNYAGAGHARKLKLEKFPERIIPVYRDITIENKLKGQFMT